MLQKCGVAGTGRWVGILDPRSRWVPPFGPVGRRIPWALPQKATSIHTYIHCQFKFKENKIVEAMGWDWLKETQLKRGSFILSS